VSTATVLIGAVLVPLQLSEIGAAALQAQREAGAQPASSTPERLLDKPTNVVTAELPSKGPGAALVSRDEMIEEVHLQIAQFDMDAECSRCHLRVHQHDARFCRNCAALLTKRRFD
jgi:hypothetical protein